MGPSWVSDVQQGGPTLGFLHPPLLPAQPDCGAGAAEAPGCWRPIWGSTLPTRGPELGAWCSLLRPRSRSLSPCFHMTSKLWGTGWRQVGRNTGSRSPGAPSCPALHAWALGTPTLPARRTAPRPSLCFASSAVCPRPPFRWDTERQPVLQKILTCFSSEVTTGALQAFLAHQSAILPPHCPRSPFFLSDPVPQPLRAQHTHLSLRPGSSPVHRERPSLSSCPRLP